MSGRTAMPGISMDEIWESIPAGLVVVDRDLRIIAYNRCWADLCEWRFDKKSASGMDISLLVSDEAPARMLAEATHGAAVHEYGYCFSNASHDGERYFDLTAIPLKGGAMLMAADSTGHCRDLRNTEAARSEAEFYVDLMSHDIRNFNQVTMGYIELLQLNDSLNEMERSYLEKAQKGVAGSNRLIDNIKKVRLIRQFAGKSLSRLDLNEALKKDAEEVRNTSPAAKIKLDLDRVSRQVVADDYVHEIFRHIMENAVKYDPHPEKVIEVNVRPVQKDGKNYWSVSIADHGAGIPDDKKKSVFERMTTTTKGAGVGLSIVSVLVRKYSGSIYVEDRVKGDPSQGSVFTVELPQA